VDNAPVPVGNAPVPVGNAPVPGAGDVPPQGDRAVSSIYH